MKPLSLPSQNGAAQRQSNIELLRIFAMLIIIAHHLSLHAKFGFSSDTMPLNRLWMQFLRIGGKLGVDIFVLITGWFMIEQPRLRTDKLIRFWLQVLTYSVVIFAVFAALGAAPITYEEIRDRCLPITFANWWFASAYFVLFLIAPFFNRLLHAFDRRQYAGFLLLFGTLWCILPTLTGQEVQSNNVLWFLYVYAFAGYLRLHAKESKHKGGFYLLMAGLCVLFVFGSTLVMDVLGIRHPFFRAHTNYFYGMKMLPTFAAAVFFFLGFSRIEIGSIRWINVVSSASFGVYLLHEDPLIRPFLWKDLLHCATFTASRRLIPYSLLWIAGVFCCGTAIELFRIYVLEKRYLPLVERLSGALDRAKEKLLSRFR